MGKAIGEEYDQGPFYNHACIHVYELGKNKYILERNASLGSFGGVPLSGPCRPQPHPALDSGLTRESGLLPPTMTGPR